MIALRNRATTLLARGKRENEEEEDENARESCVRAIPRYCILCAYIKLEEEVLGSTSERGSLISGASWFMHLEATAFLPAQSQDTEF